MSTALAATLQGLTIIQNDPLYVMQPVNTMVFQTKYYHMPIPYSEIIKNNRLIQNEGYY